MDSSVTVIRAKRKTMSLTVTKDAQVVVRAPIRMPEKQIEDFVEQHEQWIHAHLEQARGKLNARRSIRFADGEKIPILGCCYTLCTVHILNPQLNGSQLMLPDTQENRGAVLEGFLRELASTHIAQRVSLYAREMGVSPTGVRITGARTRWGSCSGKNSLCFSYRLICLPLELVDAVVVHELAHIRQKNHSNRFYQEVEAILPDYQTRRSALRKAADSLLL